jgi:hypothetical protein
MPSTRRRTHKRTPERAERNRSSTASPTRKPSVVAVLNSNQDVVRILRDVLEDNWTFLQLVRQIPAMSKCPLVLTTVNKAALEHLVGTTDAFEVLGTRDDLAPLVESINRIVRRPART